VSATATPGRRVARHTGWLLGAHLVFGVMLLAQAVMVTRALGRESFGVFVLVASCVLTIGQMLDWRIWEPITKYLPEFRAMNRPDRAAGIFQLGCLLETASALVAVGIVVVSAPLAARLFIKDGEAARLILFFAPAVLLLVPVNPMSALLRLADRPGRLALQRVVTGAVQTGCTAVVLFRGPSLAGFLGAQLIGLAVGAAMLLVMGVGAARALDVPWWKRGGLAALRGRRREIIRFCLMTNLSGCSRVLTGRLDNLVLALFATPAAVGLYDIARSLTNHLRELAGPLQMSVFPEMARLAAEGAHQKLRQLERQITITLAAAVVPVCVVGTVAAPMLIPLLFGDAFEGAVLLFQILIWHLLWLPVVWIPGDLLVRGRAATVTGLNWLDAVFFVGLLLLLVPSFGAVGAACAGTTRYLVFIVLSVVVWRRLGRAMPEAAAASV
jgi:O-antigen/teichoic acid export membrane protein